MDTRYIPKIAKADLIHGAYYSGRCRNAEVARWNATFQHFVHWRTKFGSTFLETIKHPDDDKHFDVFVVHEKINPPIKKIPFKEEEPMFCKTTNDTCFRNCKVDGNYNIHCKRAEEDEAILRRQRQNSNNDDDQDTFNSSISTFIAAESLISQTVQSDDNKWQGGGGESGGGGAGGSWDDSSSSSSSDYSSDSSSSSSFDSGGSSDSGSF